jgi:hypothetical protein
MTIPAMPIHIRTPGAGSARLASSYTRARER